VTSWGKLLTALVGGLVVSVSVRADMVPIDVGAEVRQAARVCSEVPAQPTDFAGLFDYQSIVDLRPGLVQLSGAAGCDLAQHSQTRPPQILTDGQSSLSLCVSALIGLGLCSSAHCLKKLHFGHIPEWYHNGGPSQIGHSLAINPDSICPVPAYCFVQATHAAEDIIPQYRSGTIISLWRKSQFTPDVIASRGPPKTC